MQVKLNRIQAIQNEVAEVKKTVHMIRVQQPGFDHLEVFSANQKINSILRTLSALHGRSELLSAVRQWQQTPEGQELSAAEAWELYQAVKAAVKWEGQ